MLIEYCALEIDKCNDPISKYCIKLLKNSKYRFEITVLNDILEKLASLCRIFQRSLLTVMDAMQFAKAKIHKLRTQYLGERVYWNANAKDIIDKNPGLDISEILQFIELLCRHLENRFPEEDVIQ